MKKPILLLASHIVAGVFGFSAGIYALPILTAPPSPELAEIREAAADVQHSGQFRRGLEDSDMLHWGDGTLFVSHDAISLEGEIAPGPDYKLYLSPTFVETEADFMRLKATMVKVGDVRTFKNLIVPVPSSIDPSAVSTAIVWCESFGQFITAARYQ